MIPIQSRRPTDDVAGPDAADGPVARMLAAIPTHPTYDRAALCACIEAVQECATAATACADACLAEEMVEELTTCIRTLINTADVCDVTARVCARTCRTAERACRMLLAEADSAAHPSVGSR